MNVSSETKTVTICITLPPVEMVAELVHNNWVDIMRSKGVDSRLSNEGEEQMVPYEELPEHIKEVNRCQVRCVYRAVEETLMPRI